MSTVPQPTGIDLLKTFYTKVEDIEKDEETIKGLIEDIKKLRDSTNLPVDDILNYFKDNTDLSEDNLDLIEDAFNDDYINDGLDTDLDSDSSKSKKKKKSKKKDKKSKKDKTPKIKTPGAPGSKGGKDNKSGSKDAVESAVKDISWDKALTLYGGVFGAYAQALIEKSQNAKKGMEQFGGIEYLSIAAFLEQKGYIKFKGAGYSSQDELLGGMKEVTLDEKLSEEKKVILMAKYGKEFIDNIDNIIAHTPYKKAMAEARKKLNSEEAINVMKSVLRNEGLEDDKMNAEDLYASLVLRMKGLDPKGLNSLKQGMGGQLEKLITGVPYEVKAK